MKIIFAGTPEMAIPTLELLNENHDVVGVITRPDARRGRSRELTASPVAAHAKHLGLTTTKISTFDSDAIEQLRRGSPDLGVVVAFGALIPPEALAIPRLGWINLHFSQLPRWRGASPLQRDIISGATRAHLTVFELVPQLDAGDILRVRESTLGAHETAGATLARLGAEGALLVDEVVCALANGTAVATPQFGDVSYAPKLSASECRLDSDMSVTTAYNLFRGVTPEPGAWLESRSGRIKILECAPAPDVAPTPGRISSAFGQVAIGFRDGALGLVLVQPAGKSAMSANDWMRGLQSPQSWSFE